MGCRPSLLSAKPVEKLEAGRLRLPGGNWGEYAYTLTTIQGAATYVLQYVRSFTEVTSTDELIALNERQSSKGQSIRSQSQFSVINCYGEAFFVKEFLDERVPRQCVSAIKHPELLLKSAPEDFLELALKAIPQFPTTMGTELQKFYREIIQIDQLIESIHVDNSPKLRLAGILIELSIWSQLEMRVLDQVEDHVEAQLWHSVDAGERAVVMDQVKHQVRSQVRAGLANSLWDRLEAHIEPLVIDRVWDLVDLRLWVLYEEKIDKQVAEDLRHFQFATAHEIKNLNEVLESAIDYTFMVHQIASLAMRHSRQLKLLQTAVAEGILEGMSDVTALSLLSSLEAIDDGASRYLSQTHLEIINKYL
ncbi:MAG: hypothetical protein HRU09_20780 [Oligoflexales bacterium]|nr:hypothetical protein [Oligoflexales bacterium]